MSNKKSAGRLKLAAIVGVAGLLGWLISQFNGPGTGWSGTGTERDSNRQAAVQDALEDSDVVTDTAVRTISASSDAVKFVDIVMDAETYWIRPDASNPDELRQLSLEEVVTQAQNTVGNDGGVRVRLSKRENTKVLTRRNLLDALKNAGIESDQVLELSDFVD